MYFSLAFNLFDSDYFAQSFAIYVNYLAANDAPAVNTGAKNILK